MTRSTVARIATFAALSFLAIALLGQSGGNEPFRNPDLAAEKRAADIVSRMTIEEKIRQLDMYWGKEVAQMKGHESDAWDPQKTAAMLGNAGAGSVQSVGAKS